MRFLRLWLTLVVSLSVQVSALWAQSRGSLVIVGGGRQPE